MRRPTEYVASRVAWANGRPVWRLYSIIGTGALGKTCPLGDYQGRPGTSGLALIRRSLERRGPVTARRIVRDQVAFRVAGAAKGGAK